MCKKDDDKRTAIGNFFNKLHGEGVAFQKPRALYEIADDGRADLVGFAAIIDGLLNFFRVMSDNSVRCDGMIPYPAMGNGGIAAYYDIDYAEAL